MKAPFFPVGTETWLAKVRYITPPPDHCFAHGPIQIAYDNVHHPGSTYGYRIRANGKTILYSSHVLEVVEKLCSKVIVLYQGRVVADDSVERLRDVMALASLEEVFSQLVEQRDPEGTAGIVRWFTARWERRRWRHCTATPHVDFTSKSPLLLTWEGRMTDSPDAPVVATSPFPVQRLLSRRRRRRASHAARVPRRSAGCVGLGDPPTAAP
jgi:hypothetical protein